ncbi:hypothetical protein RCL_jg3883.t1 [Rhizophagus clarus]|uniref:Uncharacterized protein n=1 Tax=Rhizophagus clarus TaxID=94130 RepID=A0A8H3QC00_9GLOM|nr:hypothetical protein RCL_jg3883.t1 [Rhizophagus clarus]
MSEKLQLEHKAVDHPGKNKTVEIRSTGTRGSVFTERIKCEPILECKNQEQFKYYTMYKGDSTVKTRSERDCWQLTRDMDEKMKDLYNVGEDKLQEFMTKEYGSKFVKVLKLKKRMENPIVF